MNNDITYTTMNKHLVVDKEWVKKRIEENGLIMIESTFTMLNNGFFAFTSEGYIVKVTSNSIYKNQSNPIFSNLNPYTIYNINRYIYLNNIDTILLSTEYKNNHENLEWLCNCGKPFKACWNNFLHGQIHCRKCANRRRHLISHKKIIKDFRDRGYEAIIDEDKVKSDKVSYYCNKHKKYGLQNIKLGNFYDRNQGCRYCANEKNASKRAFDKDTCKKITESKSLNYIDSYILDGKTVIDFTCNKHIDKGIQRYTITQMQRTKCGCKYCNMSYYTNEEKIDNILKSWNINFQRQVSFKECRDKNALPFDFYIPSFNLLMEYQGEQHYIPIPRSNMTDKEANENLVKIQNHDKIKRKYCEDNNINFIEIPYWENEDLENYLFDKFLDLNFIIEIKTSA